MAARSRSELVFLSRPSTLLRAFANRYGIPLRPLAGDGYALPEVLAALDGGSILVSDTYDLDEEALAEVAWTRVRHAVVDDFARHSQWPCDVVVNPNLGASAEPYAGARHVLAGERYALLRREVRAAARAAPKRIDSGRRVLVCLGGGSWPPAAERVLRAVAGLGENVRATTRDAVPPGVAAVDPDSLPQQLAWADVGVISGGVIKYEAAACGLPSLVLAAVEHQERVAFDFAARGAAVYLGSLRTEAPKVVAAEVLALLDNSERRLEMSAAGRRLVDGRGADRVAETLLA